MDSHFNSFFRNFAIRYIKGLKQPEDIWFNASDIGHVLGYSNLRQTIERNVMPNEIISIDTRSYPDQYLDRDTYIRKLELEGLLNDVSNRYAVLFPKHLDSRYNPVMNYIHEFAAYRLIARSNKPIAIEFSNWVYNMVRCVRVYGMYIDGPTRKRLENNPNILNDMWTNILFLDQKNKILLEDGNNRRTMCHVIPDEIKSKYSSDDIVAIRNMFNNPHIE